MAQQNLRDTVRKFTTDSLRIFDSPDTFDWGLLPEAKADEFIDITIAQSALLKAATTYRVKDRAGEFYSFDLPSPVLRTALAEGQTWPGQNAFDTGSFVVDKPFQYSCTKILTALNLTWETINWALTGPEFENFLVSKWQQRMADDLEILAIQGDTTLTGNQLLKIDNGWIKQIETSTGAGITDHSAHIIDWEGAPVDHTLWQTMRLALLRDPLGRQLCKNLSWFCTPTVNAQYMHYLSDRGDALGAAALMGAASIRPDGIPFFNDPNGVPYLPEHSDSDGTYTNVILGDPKNFWFIIHREFRLERERVALADLWRWIGYAYIDFLVPWPRAFVMAKNVKIIDVVSS